MNLRDMKARVRRQSFQPIRVHVSDQSHYEIYYPELIPLGRTEVTIVLPDGESDLCERLVHIDPLHVTRIELLPAKKSVNHSKRQR